MDLRGLIADLPGKTGMVHTFERGKALHYSHASLHGEVMQVRQALLDWRVRPGMRVGIYAPNSLAWMIHDLALIDIDAISVPFTDDFAGQVNDELLARYDVALLLIFQVAMPRIFRKSPRMSPSSTPTMTACARWIACPSPKPTAPTSTAWSFHRARRAGSRAW